MNAYGSATGSAEPGSKDIPKSLTKIYKAITGVMEELAGGATVKSNNEKWYHAESAESKAAKKWEVADYDYV